MASRVRYAGTLLALGALTALTGCTEDTGTTVVLDSLVAATDVVFSEIDSDLGLWLTDVGEGSEVSGTVTRTGSIDVTGWRSSVEYTGGAQYQSFGEKLFLDFNAFQVSDITLTGNVVVTRHTLDFGTETQVQDASRTTRYVGNFGAFGSVTGQFVVDVHANASGATLWTCGVINDEEIGQGRCY